MGQLEISSHSFALRSGVREDGSSYATCINPHDATLRRKGALALLVEPAGEHPSLAEEACRIAQAAITRQYFADGSLGMTKSLLSALDSANRAVLEHDHVQADANVSDDSNGAVAVQGGGVRLRGAKVGVTAVLFRPDGAGVYLAQLAPTQAYIVHNGGVQALPEPPSWSSAEDPIPGELWEGEDDSPDPQPPTPIHRPSSPLPAQSLGSQPGIVVDLIYRRMESGDFVVLVSPSLSRHLDRATAEMVLLHKDAASITEALYEIAQERGLARATASVIGIGHAAHGTSGVSADSGVLYAAPEGEMAQANGGKPAPLGALSALKSRLPSINLGATMSRAHNGPESRQGETSGDPSSESNELAEPIALYSPDDIAHYETTVSANVEDEAQAQPTAAPHQPLCVLPHERQNSLDVPPYKQPTLLFGEVHEHHEPSEETTFDGWEDLPPALHAPKYPMLQRLAAGAENAPPPSEARSYLRAIHPNEETYTSTRIYNIQRPPPPPPAYIEFGDDLLDDAPSLGTEFSAANVASIGSIAEAPNARMALPRFPRMPRPALTRVKLRVSPAHLDKGKVILRQGATWSAAALKSLLPERAYSPREIGGKRGDKRLVLPRRTVIIGAVVLLMGILLFSVLSSGGNRTQKATINFLQEAKQADLLANQPGITDIDRKTQLVIAHDKAQLALQADPQSVEAKRLLAKVQGALDKAEGITRLKEPKLLFDLGKVSAAGTITTSNVIGTLALSEMLVQSDDAYVLDKAAGRIYRCKMAAQSCSPVLSSGDSAGGEKVGKLVAMTMRVGSLVALDDHLVTYIYNADTSTWQAQPLGDASTLQLPKDVATYDGNLYLLSAKPGQVSKYASGAYGAPPADWLRDAASIEQVKEPLALSVDGVVYVLLGDGKILVMQGGKVVKTITPTGSASPAADLFTGTDVTDLYLLRTDGTITRVSKEGQTLATLKPTLTDGSGPLTGMAVDEGRGKLYLLKGQYVYEAILPGRITQSPIDGASQQPPVKPTVEP